MGTNKNHDPLERAVQAAEQCDQPLDRSYESLDRLEDYYRQVLGGTLADDDGLPTRLAHHLGETLVERAGGVWATERDRAVVTRIPHLSKGHFDPSYVVLTFRRTRTAGSLRDQTVAWDVVRRRRDLADATEDTAGAIASLRDELRALLGRDPGALAQGPTAALDALEEGLRALIATNAPRVQKRALRGHAIVYLGDLLHRACGTGEWSVCEEAAHADLGQFRMAGWAPWNAMRVIGPKSKPGLLRANLEDAIAARKNTRRIRGVR